jgi:hypothetical protein
MIEFLIEIISTAPQVTLRYPGNFILYYLFQREVDLDDNSFSAYALGIVVWLIVLSLVWLAVALYWK